MTTDSEIDVVEVTKDFLERMLTYPEQTQNEIIKHLVKTIDRHRRNQIDDLDKRKAALNESLQNFHGGLAQK